MIRCYVVCIIVFIVSICPTSLCFVDDLCQILGMFSLIVLILKTKCGPAGILEEIQPTDVCMFNVLKLTERFEVIF